MQARYKDLFKRLNFHIMFLVLALYIILSSFNISLNGQLEVVTMTITVIAIVVMVRTFPKQRQDTVIVTPIDKKWMEYSSYIYTGLFLLQYLLNGTQISILRGYIGIFMFGINLLTIYVIYKIIKK